MASQGPKSLPDRWLRCDEDARADPAEGSLLIKAALRQPLQLTREELVEIVAANPPGGVYMGTAEQRMSTGKRGPKSTHTQYDLHERHWRPLYRRFVKHPQAQEKGATARRSIGDKTRALVDRIAGELSPDLRPAALVREIKRVLDGRHPLAGFSAKNSGLRPLDQRTIERALVALGRRTPPKTHRH